MKLKSLVALAAIAASASLQAATITGQLSVDKDANSMIRSVSVDFHKFSTGDALLTVQATAASLPAGPFSIGLPDPMLWLFYDDGSLDTGDWVAENDDRWDQVNEINYMDSHLEVNISAGNYILAIGTCCDFGANYITDGRQGEEWQPWGDLIELRPYGPFEGPSYGPYYGPTLWDYQLDLTFGPQTAAVPEPSMLALSLASLALMAARRRKNRR